MNKTREKIATELKILAKSLIAKNIANKAGEYKHFTGRIDWKDVHGDVTNADFLLQDHKTEQIKFYSGTWNDGNFIGYWWSGVWKDGTFEDGYWAHGTWNNGTWKDGIHSTGTWYNGIWEKGFWEKGSWYDGVWYDGIWKKGTWAGGVWKKGRDIRYRNHGQNDSPDKW